LAKEAARELHDAGIAFAITGGRPPRGMSMLIDVLIFRKSGFSIAMGNSSDEVKAQASAVTDSNESEGFAKAVRKCVLPPAAP
jgi:hydroxymethylpyrimidine pyrophosphatase-like HAD family hydrolase